MNIAGKTLSGSRTATFALAATILFAVITVEGKSLRAQAGQAQLGRDASATVQGVVLDTHKRPIAGALVVLEAKNAQTHTATTDSAGAYRFSAVGEGVYTLRAEMAGYSGAAFSPFLLGPKEYKTIDFTLELEKTSKRQNTTVGQPEYFDEPHFTVAGVTDTTSLGGHGSDVIVRNRESLAKATASLSAHVPLNSQSAPHNAAMELSLRRAVEHDPESFEANHRFGKLLVDEGKPEEGITYLEHAARIVPGDYDNGYELALARADGGDYERARTDVLTLLNRMNKNPSEKAEVHHLLAEVDEKLGVPLDAVREYQRSAELNPSEPNFFDWGTELLVHRAAEPAIEVFTKGNRLFPRSVRMLSGLGASWYALGSYEQASQRLCEASDLNPDDPNPYLFMGKIQVVEPIPSDAIAERLARFVRLQPLNALANYYYAVSLWKRRGSTQDVADMSRVKSLLEKSVQLDPKLGLGYLQLGVLYAEQGDFTSALSNYLQAIATTPDLEQAHYRLAQAYTRIGETPKGQAELQLYEKISKEKAAEVERQRHEVQQFVYQLQERPSASQSQ